jgi:hypothetical protein
MGLRHAARARPGSDPPALWAPSEPQRPLPLPHPPPALRPGRRPQVAAWARAVPLPPLNQPVPLRPGRGQQVAAWVRAVPRPSLNRPVPLRLVEVSPVVRPRLPRVPRARLLPVPRIVLALVRVSQP